MSSFNSFLSASITVLLITFGLSACGNNDETTSEEVGAAEEIRGTILDTTTKAAEKAAETTAMAAEKATEAANKAVEATSEAVEEATIAVADAVESATEAVESKIAVPSITPEEAADD